MSNEITPNTDRAALELEAEALRRVTGSTGATCRVERRLSTGELVVVAEAAVGSTSCRWCGAEVELKGRGRPASYCSSACRVARHRAERRVERARAELEAAEAALEVGPLDLRRPEL